MIDRSYLRQILKDRYGIETDADLTAAISKMNLPDLGAMVSATNTDNRKECMKCAC